MSQEELTLEDYEKYLDAEDMITKSARYGGLPLGTVVQFAEHSPERFEDWTGVEVPDQLFEEVYDPIQADKGAHMYVCYSASAVMLDVMESSDIEYNIFHKAATVNLSTLIAGSMKEFTDNIYDVGDMAANMIGANVALSHHMHHMTHKYEQEFGVDIDSGYDLVRADVLYQEFVKQDLNPEDVDPVI